MCTLIRLLFASAIVFVVFLTSFLAGVSPVHVAAAVALVMAADCWLRTAAIVGVLRELITVESKADGEDDVINH